MDDLTFRMIELAGRGFHCSQVLLLLGLEAQGKTNPDLIRAVHPLAGGFGFSGDICGTLTGAVCVFGLYAGRGTVEEEEDPKLHIMVNELIDWFRSEIGDKYGGIHCEQILDEDPNNQRSRCPDIIMKTYEKVQSLLIEYGFDLSEGK